MSEVSERAVQASWEWIGEDVNLTREEIHAKLETLPDVFKVKASEYVDHVVPLPQSRKKKVSRNGRIVEEKEMVTRLYMAVSGRLAMLRDAADKNSWLTSLEPVDTGIPALGELGAVNRSRLTICASDGTVLMVRHGTSKQSGAYAMEKAETAAHGRAIATLGLGVLPGSGVASLEEMTTAAFGNQPEEDGPPPPKTREDLLTAMHDSAQTLAAAKGWDEDELLARMTTKLDRMGVRNTWGEDDNGKIVIDWRKVNDGQLTAFTAQLVAAASAADETD